MSSPPEKWDCHSDIAPNRVIPAWALQDRMCGFYHLDGDNPSMEHATQRCEGCDYGPMAAGIERMNRQTNPFERGNGEPWPEECPEVIGPEAGK